jgi:uncharacterized peroxidase-related enzyme
VRDDEGDGQQPGAVAGREAWLAALAADWRAARLAPPDAALCVYAEKLTRSPAAMTESDVLDLRGAGFDDRAIQDAIQVIAYFNYINRVADALHVDLEPEMRDHPRSTEY